MVSATTCSCLRHRSCAAVVYTDRVSHDWDSLRQQLAVTSSKTVNTDRALVDVLRWCTGLAPKLGHAPHNQHWQLAQHTGLIVRGEDGQMRPTDLGWVILETGSRPDQLEGPR